ncbi:hypothetical protein JKP75_04300 [Blastococcus sp. TML/M2B]|uniref:hypothetical protein n=1 Tax=Blastococcus sp. TML/M2B TaxID=2798727 RepID=UPI00190923DA|nr:hypothetical protein [Blastococcus sp. TML/M2B]MBN1091858.1 hypothetical protein [Blastococcus sp. TML/M2B]
MADELHRKRPDIPVVVGDMATATVDGAFALVYVVWNSLGNVRTQAGQVATVANAARHLAPGGHLVVELSVPALRRFPPGQTAVPFHVGAHHVGFDTLDLATQQGTSHHYWRRDDGTVRYAASNFRYVWPAELDLMAQLAGLEFVRRTEDWRGAPFDRRQRERGLGVAEARLTLRGAWCRPAARRRGWRRSRPPRAR